MKKALVLASVASMIDQFNIPNIKLLLELGYEVYVACNFVKGNTCSQEKIARLKDNLDSLGVKYYQIDFARDVFRLKENVQAYRQVKQLIKDNNFELIHCHSPIGGVIGRLAACKARKKGARVIYTAHGFHFYKGAPKKNWILFFPIEYVCSFFTDVLITINTEDYHIADKKLHAIKTVFVPGVGIDTKKICNVHVNRNEKRTTLGIPLEAKVLISVGEINQNKNHETVIRALADKRNKEFYYLIVGQGEKKCYLEKLTKELKMDDRVFFMGFRSDVIELYKTSDICVFPSYREGLSVALMEAMCSGLPCIVSEIRGNVDLIDENGGLLFSPYDISECAECIARINDIERKGSYNEKKISRFDIDEVQRIMEDIYYIGREAKQEIEGGRI